MGDFLKAMFLGHSVLQFLDEAFLDLHHPITAFADKMMVMVRRVMTGELKPSHAVPKIEAFHQTRLNQQPDGTIDRGEIAFSPGQGGVNLFVRQRMGVLAQDFKNRFTLTSDTPRTAPELLGQLRFGRRFVRRLLHFSAS